MTPVMTLVAQRPDVDDSEPRWMTYPELGEAFGITAASAKRLAIRRRWPKRPGNDGRARVGVPVEAIPVCVASDIPSDDTSDAPGDVTGDDTGAVTAAVTALQRHIERLERETETLKAERDEARAMAAAAALQMGGLTATLEAIREERDWHRDRRWWQRRKRSAAG
jgi:hypothetical protein